MIEATVRGKSNALNTRVWADWQHYIAAASAIYSHACNYIVAHSRETATRDYYVFARVCYIVVHSRRG